MADPGATLFVYGTLKRGGTNHHLLARQRFLGAGQTVAGFQLYELGGYPGMLPDRHGGSIIGEVWEVDASCLAQLDELEGTAEGLYRRAPVQLLPPFSDRQVETYFYLQSVAGRKILGATWVV